MFLNQLHLYHFRNYPKNQFDFKQLTTVLLGPNTIGKTNLLEAIYFLAIGKSFRADRDGEMIGWGNEVSRIKCQASLDSRFRGNDNEIDNEANFLLEIRLTTGLVGGQKAPIKKFLVNGIARRYIDFIGNLKAVLFWPEDLELVTDSPSLRRRYLDFVLVQVDREYRRSLLSYEKGIRQRNRLLERIRDEGVSRSQLVFWDQLLIKTGNYITQKREEFITAINQTEKPFGQFNIIYDFSHISSLRLDQYKEAEVAAGLTLVGPHRDDLQFLEKERDLAKFGSRGEQRLSILWLKLAELDYIEKATATRPILLLDDIFSELDHQHREEILKIIDKQQTIITTTDVHFLPKDFVRQAEVIELNTGDK